MSRNTVHAWSMSSSRIERTWSHPVDRPDVRHARLFFARLQANEKTKSMYRGYVDGKKVGDRVATPSRIRHNWERCRTPAVIRYDWRRGARARTRTNTHVCAPPRGIGTNRTRHSRSGNRCDPSFPASLFPYLPALIIPFRGTLTHLYLSRNSTVSYYSICIAFRLSSRLPFEISIDSEFRAVYHLLGFLFFPVVGETTLISVTRRNQRYTLLLWPNILGYT